MRHWVFDLDGTLVDSFPRYFASLDEIFHRHGAQFTRSLWHASLSEPVSRFFSRQLGQNAVSDALSLLRTKSNEDALRIRPFPGMVEILENLKSRCRRIGVWTNRDRVSANLILKHSGLENYVEFVVSGTCVKEPKPHCEGILKIAGFFQCEPSAVVMVGDHEHDMIAARKVEGAAIRASWHGHFPFERCPHAHYQFSTTGALSEWLATN